MEFFELSKLPVNLWRNGAGESREICCFPPDSGYFNWRASIASLASSGEFASFDDVDRAITLLEGGEVLLDGVGNSSHVLKRHQPFFFPGDKPVYAELTQGVMSMNFNLITQRSRCNARTHIADRTFTTLGTRGGIAYVLSGEWQFGDKLLRPEQGAWWEDGLHTVRLLQNTGTLLYSEITYL